ncbi:hypothetical protein M378DRAFT_14705 [Amanita muscaria Koide BX008]|uniref:trimethyllysine dioxygenase n=1 Tax=Amanita muscaria (strain Koide BX008) TaxID=946122 RepID=A0A0C2WTB8_AMAMK|nr:hypothetical protein M378DRAFT_14705 [Amanita muscaria Koide BX008]
MFKMLAIPRRALTARCWTHASRMYPNIGIAAREAMSHGSVRWTASSTTLNSTVTNPEPNAPFATVNDLPIVGEDTRKISIGWDARTWSRFHNVWLRDHCRCPQCFHPITKQRLLDTFAILPDLTPFNVTATTDGLQVTWPDAHVSLYPWSWLKDNSYDPPLRNLEHDEKILWGAKIAQSPPEVTYEEVMVANEKGLHKWLDHVDKFGFCFVSGVPATPETTEELSRKIAFIRETQYGQFWDFTSDLAKGDTAYTTMALGAHTDTTYFTDPCGLQLFHLLSHTDGSGGASLLVDGFYVASILKELHPEAYEVLSQVPVPAHAAGELSALYQPSPTKGYPILRHDPANNQLFQVRWNNDDRSVMNYIEPGMVDKWYDAIRLWHQGLQSPDSEYWVQLRPGTAVVIDNHRVLHGRSAFDGRRRMCGAYIGMDEFRSKLAVLREKFGASHGTDGLPPDVGNGRNVWHNAL